MSIISKQNKTSLNRERGFIPSSHSACTLAHCFLQDRVSQGYNKQPVLPLIRGPKMFSEIELFITAPLMAELPFWGRCGFLKRFHCRFYRAYKLPFPRKSCVLFLSFCSFEFVFIQRIYAFKIHSSCLPQKKSQYLVFLPAECMEHFVKYLAWFFFFFF